MTFKRNSYKSTIYIYNSANGFLFKLESNNNSYIHNIKMWKMLYIIIIIITYIVLYNTTDPHFIITVKFL